MSTLATSPTPLASVVSFWFKDLATPEKWFKGGPQVDSQCKSQFLQLYNDIAASTPPEAFSDPQSALGAVIVYDQIPRNIFRGTPAAFATDPKALAVSKNAVAKGLDSGLSTDEKMFLYMPHMHSESVADQDEALRLFSSLGEEGVKAASGHRDIVRRFGRFPHRNKVLGRVSTSEEEEFVAGHAGFGQ